MCLLPRHSLKLATLVLAFCSLLLLSQSPASAAATGRFVPIPKPTIVLVHGAWADASSWTGEISRLEQAGYTVVAPANPLRGVTYDAGVLRSFLSTIKGPIILVGHSYGGMVITNAATGNPQVKALVYVDAFIPNQGETANQLLTARPGTCLGGGGDIPTHDILDTYLTYPLD
jgi:pimeloyl-ACP methyl ester carboxylesterase